ncbi:NAD(P)H-binding protein [Streptomyces sp. NPDC005526]|uniref:NAD(P)H-binding protein n=1 Tax=Streptomyces sp. NPDC005526 TaxID=3156885 RepID=UPI0033A55F5F
MILLTGGTGTVGRLVARRLSGVAPVRVLTRDPRRVAPGPQVESAAGDFGDPASLERALAGVRSALLVTVDPLAPAHDEHFVTAALRAGVGHVVKLSALAVTDAGATDLITAWQRGNERLLRESGLSWTMLRPRAFMSNTLSWARSVREEGVVRAPGGHAPNATVDPRDVAEVAAAALLDPDTHAGRCHALTGPESVSAAEQTRVLADLLRRPLRYEELAAETERELLRARYPAPLADALLESAARGRSGAKARVRPTVEQLLGRPARAYRDWAADHLEAFGG